MLLREMETAPASSIIMISSPPTSQEIVPAKVPLLVSKETYAAILTSIAIAAYLILRYTTQLPMRARLVPLLRHGCSQRWPLAEFPILISLGKKLWARECSEEALANPPAIARFEFMPESDPSLRVLSLSMIEQYRWHSTQ